MPRDLAVAAIKNRLRHRARPRRIHADVKRVHINSRFLPVIRKSRLVQIEEMADEVHVRVVIEADAENRQTLWPILFAQLDQHRKFLTAWFAPSGPESNEQRFAAEFCEHAFVPTQ